MPPLRSPAALFERLFPAENAAARARRRERLRQDRSILDLVNDQARSLRSQLGSGDSRRMEAYLDSVRNTERRVQIADGFIDASTPQVNRSDFQLTATDVTTMIDTYLDLIFLALRTDQTRIFTFPFAMDMEDTIISYGLAEIAGHTGARGGNWHEFRHSGDTRCQRVDRWCVERVVRFARKLKETQEGDGTMLDRTMLVHGGSQVRTHDCSNFPILLLGGKGLGVRQGEHRRYRQGETPFSSLSGRCDHTEVGNGPQKLMQVITHRSPGARSFEAPWRRPHGQPRRRVLVKA